jgi:hypothetical protein
MICYRLSLDFGRRSRKRREETISACILIKGLTPKINNQSKSIFTHPSSQFQSKFVFESANNVSILRVVTYNIWAQRSICELTFGLKIFLFAH